MLARPCTAAVAAVLAAPLLVAAPAAASHSGTGPHARDIADSCPPARVQPAHFDDVPSDNVHALAVDCVAWWDITQGRTATGFEPGSPVERGQMASFLRRLVEASGGTLAPPSRDWFPDDDGVHEESINLLAEAGIVNGRADGRFRPELAVQRGQMATFLVNTYGERTGTELPAASRDAFADDEADFHEANIDRAAEAGFVAGVAGGGYAPSVAVRRDGMASFLSRVLDLLVEEGFGAPPPVTSGDFDLAFGTRGTAAVSFGERFAEAHAVAEAPDGKVVAVGSVSRHVGLVRLTAAGALDATFGQGGRVTTPVGVFSTAMGVAVQSDGKVVLGGRTNPSSAEVDSDFALARYTVDGQLDPTFGGDGIVTSSFRGVADITELVLQPDGKVLVGGTAVDDRATTDEGMAFERYLADGRLDTGFGVDGRVVLDVVTGPEYVDGLVLQPDGRIVAAGSGGGNQDSDALVVRLLPDGSLDQAFGDAGVAAVAPGPFARFTGVALQSDGSVVAAGSQTNAERTVRQVVVARFSPSGELDAAFGDGGVAVAQPAPQAEASDVTVDAADRVVVVGRGVSDANRNGQSWVVLRLLPDGGLDSTFSDDGQLRSGIGRTANAVTVDSAGKLLVAGCDCPFEAFGRGGIESTSSMLVSRLRTED